VRLQPEVIHFEFGTVAVAHAYLKELLRCKVVVSFRGYDLNFIGLDDSEYYREVWEHGCSPANTLKIGNPFVCKK
jgi:colanic acid/amylovoran biosynthesis glycosyltransferase